MKNVLKILGIIFLIFIIINIGEIYTTKVFASGMSDVAEDPESWKPDEAETDYQLNRKVGVITGAIKIIGVLVSVISLSIIGIKFMLGSVEEKAQYKQTLIPWIIGACMVFAMTLIPDMIYNFVNPKYNANTGVSKEYYTGYLSGYNEGITFWKNWKGEQSTVDEKRKYYNNLIRNNAEANGKADGGLAALASNRDINFCNGYSKAASWIQNENPTAEQIGKRMSNPVPGMPSNEISGYNQRLDLQLKILNSY